MADISYIPTWNGFLYLAVVLDVFSRRIVGWAMETSLHTELVLPALNMALGQRRPGGVIHHSDHGSQDTSFAFGKRCEQAGIWPSMGSVGDRFDKRCAKPSLPCSNANPMCVLSEVLSETMVAEGKPNKNSLATQAEDQYRTASERRAEAKALRENVPSEAQGGWKSPKDRRNPVELLLETNEGRLPELVPIRQGRVVSSPFAFFTVPPR